MTNTAASDPVQAALAALIRHGAALVLWVGWFVTRAPLEADPGPVSLVLIVALTFLYVLWVNRPLEQALGPRYARRPHWSALFVIPSLFAIVMLVRDLLLTGRAFFG